MNIEKTTDDLRKENDILDAAYKLIHKKIEGNEFDGFVDEEEIIKIHKGLLRIVNILMIQNKSQACDIYFGKRDGFPK